MSGLLIYSLSHGYSLSVYQTPSALQGTLSINSLAMVPTSDEAP